MNSNKPGLQKCLPLCRSGEVYLLEKNKGDGKLLYTPLVKLTLQSWYLNKIAWIRKSGGQDSAESLSNSFICELAAEHQMCARKNFWSAVTNEGDTGKKRLSAFKRLKVPDKSYIIFPLTNVILFSRSVWNVWRVYWGGISGGNCLKLHKLWDSVSPGANGKTRFPKVWGISWNISGSVKSPSLGFIFISAKGTHSQLSYCRWWRRTEARWKRLLVVTLLLEPRLQSDLPVNDRDCSSLHAIKCLNLPSPL